ncbi:MAG: hypothetical protein AAGA54_17660 [Myxococcota bacterium]
MGTINTPGGAWALDAWTPSGPDVEPSVLDDLCLDHFPGDPVVPGAHLIGLALRVCELDAADVTFAGFRAPVRPAGGCRFARTSRRAGLRVEFSSADGSPAARIDVRPTSFESATLTIPEPTTPDPAWPDPSASLLHGPHARFVDRVVDWQEDALWAALDGRERWHWAQLLDGAAQAAGLLFRGSARAGEPVFVASFEKTRWAHPLPPAVAPRVHARRRRRVMGIEQFDCSVTTQDGASIMTTRVALGSA